MAKIMAFKGLMYNSDTVGDMSSVVAPHCHSGEEEFIKELYSNHPFNIVRLEYPMSEEPNVDKYIAAGDMLDKWLETGIVEIEDESCLYVYEQEYMVDDQIKKVKGIICKVKMEEDVILPHEYTNTDVYDEYKSDRYNLMKTTGATFSSIYSLYKDDDKKIEEAISVQTVPDVEFTDDYDVTHRVWKIKNPEKILEIAEMFNEKKVMIADGHIRYETAVSYRDKMKSDVVEFTGEEEFNYVMMNLFPVKEDTPTVRAVHRLLKNKQNFDEEAVLEKIKEKFNVEKSYIREYDDKKIEGRLAENKNSHSFGFYTGKDYYYIITPKEDVFEGIINDAELLHKEILNGIFSINKENFKAYVEYAGEIRNAEQKVREGEANCAFYLNPSSANEIYGYAECGICTPKKTNSFYPRLMMGVVMNKFDEQGGEV